MSQRRRPITQPQQVQHHPDPFSLLRELPGQHPVWVDPDGAVAS